MASETWRRIGSVLMNHVDMRLVLRGCIASDNSVPSRNRRMPVQDFLEMLGSTEGEEPPPAA